MPGRVIPSEVELIEGGYDAADMVQRRKVLHETLSHLSAVRPADFYHDTAEANLARWNAESEDRAPEGEVQIYSGDWGDVTLALTKKHGECFAVLNMANAYVPGGGYIEGMVAQEENMYRRTDCHFRVGSDEYDESSDLYKPEMTQLLSAHGGRVYLDTGRARICVRGPEDRNRSDLGYPWLPNDHIFPFFELRASAQDLRDGSAFDGSNARKRIAAQLETLRESSVSHVVLGAFGCGAFQNPSTEIARIYREEIDKRRNDFALVAFAIFDAGYGPNNFAVFNKELVLRPAET